MLGRVGLYSDDLNACQRPDSKRPQALKSRVARAKRCVSEHCPPGCVREAVWLSALPTVREAERLSALPTMHEAERLSALPTVHEAEWKPHCGLPM